METLFKKILCPIDFSQVSAPAIELARSLASQNRATIFLLYVLPQPDPDQSKDELEQLATDQLRAVARTWFEGQTPYEIIVRRGEPAAAIVEAENQLGIDAVVIATHGRSGEEYTALGSVTEQVVRRSTQPVVTLKPR